ncbi:hypothetical protein [Flavobacterium sp. U410]|jgi:hypothetical protein
MGKEKKEKKKNKKLKESKILHIKAVENCKSKCCEKYKKGENKRCKRCPMFDLLKKVS